MITLKKKYMTLALLVTIILSISIASSFGFFVTSFSIQGKSGSSTIYCNDFEYITCAEDTLNSVTHEVVASRFFQCPSTATRCEVQGAGTYYGQPYIGSGCYLNWLQYPECSSLGGQESVRIVLIGCIACGEKVLFIRPGVLPNFLNSVVSLSGD